MKSLYNRPAAAVIAIVAAAMAASGAFVKRAASSPVEAFDDVQSCKDLPDVLRKLLNGGFAPGGQAIQVSDLYAVHYPAGSNPSAKELYETIPATAFNPNDDVDGAISGSDGFDKEDVTADQGYGEQSNSPYSREGGLPSFCRVGGMIETSGKGNRVHFEVWMPLADTSNPTDGRGTEQGAQESPKDEDRQPPESVALAAKAAFKRACSTGWTKRLVFIVGGGLRGAVAFPELKQTMARYRVAVAGTNLGHFSAENGTHWLPGNPEGWVDYGHRGAHLSTQVTQLAVSTFYGARPNPKRRKNDERVQARDSEPIFYSYFKGCSTGGRAAMAEVQRYPLDYDGVMAGSPAIDFNYLKAYQVHVNSFLHNNKSEGYFSPAALSLVHKAVLQACDSKDGVDDSVVSNPRQCKPDFAKLIGCTSLGIAPEEDAPKEMPKIPIVKIDPSGRQSDQSATPLLPRDVSSEPSLDPAQPKTADKASESTDRTPKTSAADADTLGHATEKTTAAADDKSTDPTTKDDEAKKAKSPKCLTDAQLETLKNIYTDYEIDGQLIREAVLPGSEFGWNVTKAITGKYGSSPSGWFHYQVIGDETWDDEGFDVGKVLTPALIQEGQRKDPGQTITFNPDLNEFFDAGGKLMHYHGLSDPLVAPLVSPRYYEMVKKEVGPKIRESYRLYMIPGMLHCRGGAGCFNFGGSSQTEAGSRPLSYDAKHDMLLALMEWVERGVAPNVLIGAAYKTEEGGAPKTPRDDTPFANGVRNTRPLCPYPLEARLKSGEGTDFNDASAFECA